MDQVKYVLKHQGLLLALAPLGGVLITYFFQVGSYSELGVPFDLIELSTPKTIAASIIVFFALVFYAAAYADLAIFSHDWDAKSLAAHIYVNAVMSSLFWARSNLAWKSGIISALVFTTLLSVVSMPLHWAVRKKVKNPEWKLSPYLLALLVTSIFFVVFVAAPIAAGANSQRGEKLRTVLTQNPRLVLAGTFDGQLIFKCVDPDSKKAISGRVLLVAPNGLSLSQRRIEVLDIEPGPSPLNCKSIEEPTGEAAMPTYSKPNAGPAPAKEGSSPVATSKRKEPVESPATRK